MNEPITRSTNVNFRRALAAALASSMLLAACGSTGTTPTSAGPTAPGATVIAPPSSATAPTSAASTPTLAPLPSAVASATTGPPPTLGGDVDLVSLMPTEIAGQTMTIERATDSAGSFLILWYDEQVAEDLLASLSKSAGDVDVVFSYAGESVHPEQLAVNAYRVAGADGIALRDGMVQAYITYLAPAGTYVATPTTLGGKDTIALTPPDTSSALPQYFYAVGDIVFTVDGNPAEWVAEALSMLP